METQKKTRHFLVLVPHRDCLPSLEACRKTLFSMGYNGAFSFPAAAPLALLDRPLGAGFIKAAAAHLRELLGDKKLSPQGLEICGAWDSFRFMGPALEMPPVSFPAIADSDCVVLQRWEKPLLAPVILAPADNPFTGTLPHFSSFRAMALANLSLNQAANEALPEFDSFEADYSFTWELGPLHWLPRK